MGAGAAEISPIISRMEPLGRYFDPEKPVPRAQPITPPDKTAEDDKNKPKTKRLSPPPPQEQKLTPPKPLPAAGERRYTIIVGSFSKEENALKLKQKLEDEGLPAEVVPVMNNGQPWWRVMSGVFEDRESAEAYRRELRQKNMDMPYVKAL
jgi:cell division protein FtsN